MGYIDNLIQFSAGSKALASEVNQNFEVLKTAVNDSVKKDGSIAFIAEVAGVSPTKTQSIATKGYVDSSSNKLLSQCVNLGRTTNGQADFITVGSGLKPKILALTTNLTGNCQYKDMQNKFSINADVDLPNNAPINRRSTIIYKNWTDNPAWAYACQRQQWGNTFDVSRNLLMDFTSSLTGDKYGNTVTVLGNPALSGDKYVGDGSGDGLKITSISTLGTDKWCIEGKFKFNNTNTIMQLFEAINAPNSTYSIWLARNSSNKLGLYLSSNNVTADIANNTLGTKANWDNTTEYYIRLIFDGSTYKVDWSTTGLAGSYTTDIAITSSTKVAAFDSNGLTFGLDSYANSNSLNGTMDDLRVTIGNIRGDGEAFIPDAYWYDTANKIMKYGSPASWTELSECVALGEVVTNATAVVSAVSYALNGRAISPVLTGANNTVLNFNDNIGHANKRVAVRSRFNSSYQWSYKSGVFSSPTTFGYSPTVKNDLVSSAELNTASGVVGNGDVIGYNSFPVGNQSTGEVQIIVERID